MDAISSTPSPTPEDDESLPNDVASCHQIIRKLRSRVTELESNVDAYQHPPGSNEDGYLALKLRDKGFGKLHCVTNIKALVWTTDRRIQTDGGLLKASTDRLKKMVLPSKEVVVRSDL